MSESEPTSAGTPEREDEGRLPWSHEWQPIPLSDLEGVRADRVAELGARQVNLYRSLAHAPQLLDAWIDFAWALRRECRTPRVVRELVILRTAVVTQSEYEWHQHRLMADDVGVDPAKVAALAGWQTSDLFDPSERAALMLTDAMLAGSVPDQVHAALAEYFDAQERVELVMTAGFYTMVPRVLNALRVPIEEDQS